MKRVAVVLLVVVVVLGIVGVMTAQNAAAPAGQGVPIWGTACTVQFRRDMLGINAPLPVSPIADNVQGVQVSLAGRFDHMDDQWLVINTDPRHQAWIPRASVLLVTFAP